MAVAKLDAITAAWGKLAFRRWQGGGTPTILLHPLAMSSRLWETVAGDFGAGRDIIAVDLRGHGDSVWNGEAFSIEDLASDVALLLDTLDIAQADVLGMSMGGCTAIALATARPDRVRRLALCDTTAWYGADAKTAWEERAVAAESRPRSELIPFQVQRWFADSFRQNSPDMVQHAVDVFLETEAATHAQACRALGAFDGRARLNRITAKTAVFTGEEDYATPPAMGINLAENIAGATFGVWPGVRHFSLLESPDLRAAVAQHFAADDRLQ